MKAVLFDLDDTLLHDDLTISDFTVHTLRQVRATGCQVIAASGRAQLSIKPFLDRLGCVSAYISCNGAEIWDGATDRLIHQVMLPAETARQIALFAEKHGVYAQVYDGDCFFFNRYGPCADRYAASSRLKGCYVGKLSSYIREPRNKILMIDSEQKIAAMYHEAVTLFDGLASVTCSKPIYLEFNPPEATKGNALRALLSRLNIDPADAVAFGDSLNDLSMLQAAGTGVAVSNGWKEIFPLCDDICGTNEEDGPARYILEHYLEPGVCF